jgi:transcriptional regulator with XRE-family HTH domain
VIDDAIRIRVIRALLGISGKELARRVGVTQGVVTGWEKGRSAPRTQSRTALAKICQEHKIMFLPSGFPVPAEDYMPVPAQENTVNG